jgi:hypothetical protein
MTDLGFDDTAHARMRRPVSYKTTSLPSPWPGAINSRALMP